MNKKELAKKLIAILPIIAKEFLTGGKTKLGVYLVGASILVLKFWSGIPIEVATANPEVIPALVKGAIGAGVGALGAGVIHDQIKKWRSIGKNTADLFKF